MPAPSLSRLVVFQTWNLDTIYNLAAFLQAHVNTSIARCGEAWAAVHALDEPAPLENASLFSCLYHHSGSAEAAAAPPCIIDGMGLGGHPSPLGSYL
jgi:hypothetical protein